MSASVTRCVCGPGTDVKTVGSVKCWARDERIHVPGLEVDVAVEDVGEDKTELHAGVDAAYHAKYARYGGSSVNRMTTDAAAATTLRLIPEQGARAGETP